MQQHALVALVSLFAALVCVWMGFATGMARRKTGIHAPAMVGDPLLERSVRAHANTLEWLPVFLVGLWLFALYWDDRVAALLGVAWIVGRIIYRAGYVADPRKRAPGFMIQSLATAVLVFGAIGRIAYLIATGVLPV